MKSFIIHGNAFFFTRLTEISETKLFSCSFHCLYNIYGLYVGISWFIVFNTTFNNISAISWLSVLLGEETGVPGENH